MNWFYNIVDRLTCSHVWKKFKTYDVIQYPGPISQAIDANGWVSGTQIVYKCSKCKCLKKVSD